jgi:hypothetical protein
MNEINIMSQSWQSYFPSLRAGHCKTLDWKVSRTLFEIIDPKMSAEKERTLLCLIPSTGTFYIIILLRNLKGQRSVHRTIVA